ncbi:MAG: VanZ family protein [Candidatus Zixiibacteriota bacterium]
MKSFVKYHLPVILYSALIITLSSIPQLNRIDIPILNYDKLLHFLEYAIFAFLVYRSFSHIFRNFSAIWVFLISLIFIGLFSVLDEYFQSHIPGRKSDPYDILFDTLGGVLILLLLSWRRSRRKK